MRLSRKRGSMLEEPSDASGHDEPALVVAEQFTDDLANVQPEQLVERIIDAVSLLLTTPELGSKNVPPLVLRRYGKGARKLLVAPFDIFYTYDQTSRCITVLALVHQRRAR
jgi:plasmid stabilization system protein ParE